MIDGKDFLDRTDTIIRKQEITNQLLAALLKAVEKLLAIAEKPI